MNRTITKHWLCETHYKLSIQAILPVDDIQEHNATSRHCKCQPKIQQNKAFTMIIHNAFDARETFEEIETIMNDNSKKERTKQ